MAPTCLAIILCECVVEDIRTRNKCILNTFNNITSKIFPLTIARLTVFATLTSGRGIMPMKVTLLKDGAESPMLDLKGELNFGNPLNVVDMIMDMRNIVFPSAGWYSVQVHCGGGISERRLSVMQTDAPEKD